MVAERINEAQGNLYLELCTQIGHLFLAFANLETVMTSVLKLHMAENLSGGPNPTSGIRLASAVYGSMRFKESRDTIKRVIATEPHSESDLEFLTGIFAQLAHIQAFRDMLAHQSLQRSNPERIDGTWRLSNMFTTKDLSKPLVYEFTLSAINAASADLQTATRRIGNQVAKKNILESILRDTSPIPWRYKPSMLRLVPQSDLCLDSADAEEPHVSPE